MQRLRQLVAPTGITLACVIALVGLTMAATGSTIPSVVLTQSGHWVTDQAQRTVLHVHGDTEEVDAKVALPDDAAQGAVTTLQCATDGFVVGRDRAWTFDKAGQQVMSSTPLPAGDEEPVGIETPGGPYLVYRQQGRIVRLGQPPAVVEAGGPLGTPVRTSDGTVWVHRADNGELCAFRRDAVALDCDAHVAPRTPGGLTVVADRAVFVDTAGDVAHVVRAGDQDSGEAIGADLPAQPLLADQATTSARLPVVVPDTNRLLLLDATGIADGRPAGAAADRALGAGTFSAPMVSGDIVAVLRLDDSTLSTFGADGHPIDELRLAPRTDTSDVHRGEDGRIYVDESGGARTHTVRRDGRITTLDFGLGAADGDTVAAAPPESLLKPVAPPPPGQLIIPRPGPGPVTPRTGPVVAAPGTGGPVRPGLGNGPSPTEPVAPPPAGLEPPGPPVSVTATADGPGLATITWADGANGGAPASYTVTSSQGGAVTVTLGRAEFPNLTAGSTYTFTVVATNGAGTSSPSAASNPITMPVVPQAPDAPRDVTVTFTPSSGRGAGTAEVAWGEPDLRGGTLVRYDVTLAPAGKQSTTRPVTGTSTQYSSPVDFDACSPVTVEIRTLTSVGGQEMTSQPASRRSITLATSCRTGSTLRLAPGSATVASGGTLTVKIMIDVGSQPVNAVQAYLSFPAGLLTCTSVTVDSSWLAQPEKDCLPGEVHVVVGRTPPQLTDTTVVVATVTFTAVAPGRASVSFTSESHALGGEAGADSLDATSGGTYTIT